VKIDDLNITIEEYIRIEKEKSRRRGKVYNWENATYGKIWYDKDVHDLRSVETEFPAIVYNDALTSKITLSCKPTVSPLHDNQIDFRISFDEYDDEDYTVRYELCKGPYYTKDCPPKEEGKTLKEAYCTQFGVPFQQGGQYRAAATGFYQRNNANPSYQE
ncbi:hypothetical protein Tco_0508235, partial [Tanacetum coccineum]